MNTSLTDQRTNIFVYGTLKMGFDNHHIIEGQRKVGVDSIRGLFRMHDMGYYPALVVDEDHVSTVYGEVYEVDHNCLQCLDVLEGVPHLYSVMPVVTENGVHCLTYLLNDEHASGMIVSDGNWMQKDRY